MVFGNNRRELRRRCDELIDTLPVRAPFEVTTFLHELSRQRETPLALWRMNPVRSMPTGMLVATREMDYLFVARGTSPGHAVHIAFHELGHALSGHLCDRVPGTPQGGTQKLEEAEAEEFAYRLAARVRLEERRQRLRGSYRQVLSAFGSRRQLYQYGV